ncbi:GumC family protein [Thalassococcus sp. BH17M4-6]|uniref:GumC family protein n=1 Tax=Thalassococcus sp. BH17M4-6 TaxID=3413148 RepID=UPI003BB9EBD2
MTLQETFPTRTAPARRTRRLSFRRILMGGRIGDLGRFPRYLAFALVGGTLIWAPITGYLRTAPLTFKSGTSLILPGSGASASMNLNGIGQASSYANSAFSSNSVSPTETYKRLIGADRILEAAARSMGLDRKAFGKPRIDLVDQTSLIHLEITGGTAEEAQARGEALLEAFFAELDALRADEQATREDSGLAAIADYRNSVASTRSDIARLQEETGLVSADQYDAIVEATRLLDSRVQDLAAALQDKTQSVAALEASLGIPADAAAATLKLFADAEYAALMEEVALHAADLAKARSQFGEGHPKVQAARAAHAGATGAALLRAEAVTGLTPGQLQKLDLAPEGARADLLAELVRMDAERAGAAREHETLSARLAEERARQQALAGPAARLQDLQRDFTVAEAVFASAIARTQSTKSDVYASYPLVQVLENPSLPDRPSSPNRKLAIAAGGAATMMMMLGLLLGWMRSAVIGRLINAPKDPA